MKKNSTLASLLLAVSFLTACSGGHSSYCDGPAGDLHQSLDENNLPKALEIAYSTNLDANATCKKHGTPLLVKAARLGSLELVKQLVEKGVEIDEIDNALIEADTRDHVAIVRYLQQKGARIDIDTVDGSNEFILAAMCCRITDIKHLLDLGGDIDTQAYSGDTALIKAAAFGHCKLARYLVERGAGINIRNKNGDTAFMWAASNGCPLDFIKYLIEQGASIDAQDDWSIVALVKAAADGHLPSIRHFRRLQVGVDAQDKHGETALMWAIKSREKKGNIRLFKFLIDNTKDFHLTSNSDQTVLDMAEEKFKEAEPADKKFYSLIIAMLKQKMRG